ncbi:hypothetical protein AB0D08_36915 [Kitasatospora sp. NPDC048540]
MFSVAGAVVCQWWGQALGWERVLQGFARYGDGTAMLAGCSGSP